LDNFVLFRHRLSGVDDFNSFTVHRTIGKLFLAAFGTMKNRGNFFA